MIFCKECAVFLTESMCINVSEFQTSLRKRFGEQSQQFDDICKFLINDPASIHLKGLNVIECSIESDAFLDRFRPFIKELGHDDDDDIFELAFVLFGYFSYFYSGGLQGLFKGRQPDDFGPRIYLKERICSDESIQALPDVIKVYRGMSIAEYESGSFGMSWSIDEKVAKDFAFVHYHDEPRVVVQSCITKKQILFYNPQGTEGEIAVLNDSITDGSILYE